MWSMSISTHKFSHSRNFFFTAANPDPNPIPKQPNPNLYRTSAATARFRGGRRRRRVEDEYRDITLSFDEDEEEEEETERSRQQVVAHESSSWSSDPTVEIEREIVSSWDEAGGRKLSGSDVIWALQRATANKNPKMTKSRSSRSSNSDNKIRIEESGEEGKDYSNAVVLRINKDWGTRLDDLDNRLQSLLTSLDL